MKPVFEPNVKFATIQKEYPDALSIDITGTATLHQAQALLYGHGVRVRLLQVKQKAKGPTYVFSKDAADPDKPRTLPVKIMLSVRDVSGVLGMLPFKFKYMHHDEIVAAFFERDEPLVIDIVELLDEEAATECMLAVTSLVLNAMAAKEPERLAELIKE